ncbi:MAG: GTA-gp10 family protein [Phenylobacterium sp.]|nr:GTA-gp10 family protein [Phenylobacterium sp.]
MLTNPLKGEVPVPVGSGTFTFVYSIEALIVLEAKFGKTVTEIGELLGEGLSAKDVRTLFWAGLQEYHADLDEKAAGRIASEMGLQEASLLIIQAFAGAFNSGAAASPPTAPPADPADGADGTGAKRSPPGAASSSAPPTPSGD